LWQQQVLTCSSLGGMTEEDCPPEASLENSWGCWSRVTSHQKRTRTLRQNRTASLYHSHGRIPTVGLANARMTGCTDVVTRNLAPNPMEWVLGMQRSMHSSRTRICALALSASSSGERSRPEGTSGNAHSPAHLRSQTPSRTTCKAYTCWCHAARIHGLATRREVANPVVDLP